MAIEVKLMLFDAQEIVMLAQLEAALDQKRNIPFRPEMSEPERPRTAAPEPATEPVVEAVTNAPATDDIAMQKAITEFAQRPGKGVPAARELLTEFGASKVTDVPQERRAEFLARLAE